MADDGLRPMLHGTVRAMAPGGLTNEALVRLASPEDIQALASGRAPFLATPEVWQSAYNIRCCITMADGTYWDFDVIELQPIKSRQMTSDGLPGLGEVSLTMRGINMARSR